MRWLLALWLIAAPAWAVQPDEVLPDPALEARARAISAELRCPVCQSESIDESHADIARDLRLLVRERLVAGDSDAEVLSYVTDRYGDFVRLRPRVGGANLVLWLAGPVVLLLGAGIAWRTVRRPAQAAVPLSAEDQKRLDEIMRS